MFKVFLGIIICSLAISAPLNSLFEQKEHNLKNGYGPHSVQRGRRIQRSNSYPGIVNASNQQNNLQARNRFSNIHQNNNNQPQVFNRHSFGNRNQNFSQNFSQQPQSNFQINQQPQNGFGHQNQQDYSQPQIQTNNHNNQHGNIYGHQSQEDNFETQNQNNQNQQHQNTIGQQQNFQPQIQNNQQPQNTISQQQNFQPQTQNNQQPSNIQQLNQVNSAPQSNVIHIQASPNPYPRSTPEACDQGYKDISNMDLAIGQGNLEEQMINFKKLKEEFETTFQKACSGYCIKMMRRWYEEQGKANMVPCNDSVHQLKMQILLSETMAKQMGTFFNFDGLSNSIKGMKEKCSQAA